MAVRIFFGGDSFVSESDESVLDCLSRNGASVPHSCKSGVCQSCLMRSSDGNLSEAAQQGLKPAYKKQNLFLACQYKPEHDLVVELPDGGGLDSRGTVVGKDMLNHNVLRLELAPESGFVCEPGQYITLINDDGLARSYSVANDPAREGRIELHIRLLTDGSMSVFLKEKATLGDNLKIRGPAGSCFYVREEGDDYPMVLAGTGTGLAPLYGIAKQALAQGHQGEIQLFHGALQDTDLYLVPQLQNLASAHPNFRYVPCVLTGEPGQFYRQGNIQEIVMSAMPSDKSRTRLFLCGAPETVNALKRTAFLSGLASRHIFADAFLPTQR
jgi:CDP-4-dehydro-6-deoxyglucose reductase